MSFWDNCQRLIAFTLQAVHLKSFLMSGRHDVICPMISAWALRRALEKSELRIVPDGAHSPMDAGMIHELVQATEDFKGV